MKKYGSQNILIMLKPYSPPQLELVEDPDELKPSLSLNFDEDMHEFYKKAEASFWVFDELANELSKDPKYWEMIRGTSSERFLKNILAFFSVSDFYVNSVIQTQIKPRIMNMHWHRWEDFKVMMENTHNETYGKLVEEGIKDLEERKQMLEAVKYSPTIQRKIDWMRKWIGSNNQLVHLDESKQIAIRELYNSYVQNALSSMRALNIPDSKLSEFIPENIQALGHELNEEKKSLALIVLINIFTEGIFFSSSFACIFWFKEQGMFPGLSLANEWISRDEGLHCAFGIMIYRYKLKYQLPQKLVHQIIREAVDIEADFICEALPDDMTGMNSRLMTQYVQFVADQQLFYLGYERIWNVENPFLWMEQQSIGNRSGDFFKRTISAYGHHASGLASADMQLGFDEEF